MSASHNILNPWRMMKATWHVLRTAVCQFMEDEILTRGAALAFYAALSLAPLMLLLVSVSGFVIDEATQQRMIVELEQTVGPQGAKVIDTVVENVRLQRGTGVVSFIVSIVTLALGATAVFVELQWTMNKIWGVELRRRHFLLAWLYNRALSLGTIAVLGLMLLASLVVTAALSSAWEFGRSWTFVDSMISLLIFTLLFAAAFRFLPDVKVQWKAVWIGAMVTAVLFALGTRAIGAYLGTSTFTSAYGAAGSLIALLLWVYYSSLIFFFGAEVTEVYAKRIHARSQVDDYAKPTTQPHHGEAA